MYQLYQSRMLRILRNSRPVKADRMLLSELLHCRAMISETSQHLNVESSQRLGCGQFGRHGCKHVSLEVQISEACDSVHHGIRRLRDPLDVHVW